MKKKKKKLYYDRQSSLNYFSHSGYNSLWPLKLGTGFMRVLQFTLHKYEGEIPQTKAYLSLYN